MSETIEHVVTLRVDADHPAFAGHFPGRPIVPGVLLIDWALAALQDAFPGIGGESALPRELATVKFLQPVTPGAELRLVFRIDRSAANNAVALRIEQVGIEQGDTLVASATIKPGNAA